jgi:hypothetical protein
VDSADKSREISLLDLSTDRAQSIASSTRCEVGLTLQDALRCVRSVLVRSHKVLKLYSRLELRIQEVAFVEKQHKSRLSQQIVSPQRPPRKERILLGPVSTHERCSLRDTGRTRRFTLRSSVNVWLNAETGAINKTMFTAPNKCNIFSLLSSDARA